MKKFFCFVAFAGVFLSACKNNEKSVQVSENGAKKDSMALFPVTEFILGQLTLIEKMPVTLLHTSTVSGHTDSQWVDRSQIVPLAAPFLQTKIDSALLTQWFEGSHFMDQTMGLFTITYAAKKGVPDTINLRQIIVYINPQSQQVQRVYATKEISPDTTMQLTWVPEKWFSIRELAATGDSTSITLEKVFWNFDEGRP